MCCKQYRVTFKCVMFKINNIHAISSFRANPYDPLEQRIRVPRSYNLARSWCLPKWDFVSMGNWRTTSLWFSYFVIPKFHCSHQNRFSMKHTLNIQICKSHAGQTITCAIPATLDMYTFKSYTPSAIDYAEGHSPWEDLYGTYVVKCNTVVSAGHHLLSLIVITRSLCYKLHSNLKHVIFPKYPQSHSIDPSGVNTLMYIVNIATVLLVHC